MAISPSSLPHRHSFSSPTPTPTTTTTATCPSTAHPLPPSLLTLRFLTRLSHILTLPPFSHHLAEVLTLTLPHHHHHHLTAGDGGDEYSIGPNPTTLPCPSPVPDVSTMSMSRAVVLAHRMARGLGEKDVLWGGESGEAWMCDEEDDDGAVEEATQRGSGEEKEEKEQKEKKKRVTFSPSNLLSNSTELKQLEREKNYAYVTVTRARRRQVRTEVWKEAFRRIRDGEARCWGEMWERFRSEEEEVEAGWVDCDEDGEVDEVDETGRLDWYEEMREEAEEEEQSEGENWAEVEVNLVMRRRRASKGKVDRVEDEL